MNDKTRRILFVIGLVLIIVGITNNQSTDKKTSVFTTKTFTYGGIGLALMSIFGKGGFLTSLGPWGWAILGIAAFFMFAPGLITKWTNLFRPQPTIPMWVWVVGFFILLLFVLKRK